MEEDVEIALLSEYLFLHGFGVYSYSKFEPDTSYNRACDKALEELNTNMFMSVYIEEFRSGTNTDYSFPELSIRDSLLTFDDDIVKVDSFQVAGNAYCIVGFSDYHTTGINVTPPSFDNLKMGPAKVGNTWFALGADDISRYDPHTSWLKAKNNALMDLTRAIRMLIQSSRITIDHREAELTYFKSNIIFEDVVVARRYISKNKFIVMIAVPDYKIFEY